MINLDKAEERALQRVYEVAYRATDTIDNERQKAVYDYIASFVKVGIRLMREEVESKLTAKTKSK